MDPPRYHTCLLTLMTDVEGVFALGSGVLPWRISYHVTLSEEKHGTS